MKITHIFNFNNIYWTIIKCSSYLLYRFQQTAFMESSQQLRSLFRSLSSFTAWQHCTQCATGWQPVKLAFIFSSIFRYLTVLLKNRRVVSNRIVSTLLTYVFIMADMLKRGVFLFANGLLNSSCIDYHAFYEFNASKSWYRWMRKTITSTSNNSGCNTLLIANNKQKLLSQYMWCIVHSYSSVITRYRKWMQTDQMLKCACALLNCATLFLTLPFAHYLITTSTIDWLFQLVLKSFQVVLPIIHKIEKYNAKWREKYSMAYLPWQAQHITYTYIVPTLHISSCNIRWNDNRLQKLYRVQQNNIRFNRWTVSYSSGNQRI